MGIGGDVYIVGDRTYLISLACAAKSPTWAKHIFKLVKSCSMRGLMMEIPPFPVF